MISALMQDCERKTAEYNRLKARGDAEAASRYNRECLKEGLSYSLAGLKLFKGTIFGFLGFLTEANKGINARIEQRRIVDGDK